MPTNVKEVIKKIASKNHIKLDFSDTKKDLRSLNVDSLASINLIMQIEEELKITLSDETLMKIKTLNDLIKAFEETK